MIDMKGLAVYRKFRRLHLSNFPATRLPSVLMRVVKPNQVLTGALPVKIDRIGRR